MIDRSKILVAGLASLLGAAVGIAQTTPPPGAATPPGQSGQDRERPAPAPSSSSGAAGEQRMTISGCVERGTGANQFTLNSPDGRMWTLTGNTSQLEAHVGHTVTVSGTGAGTAGSGAGAASSSGTTGGAGATGGAYGGATGGTGAAGGIGGATSDTATGGRQGGAAGAQGGATGSSSAAMSRQLNVSSVTMVSATCQSSGANPDATPNRTAPDSTPPLTR